MHSRLGHSGRNSLEHTGRNSVIFMIYEELTSLPNPGMDNLYQTYM